MSSPIGQVARRIRRRVPVNTPALQVESFNAPLYTFKAFAIATAIVVATASASVAGVMSYLDVHNTTEFAASMRAWVSRSMPFLTAKIYRRPDDHAAPSHAPAAFDHDAAQQRLAEAFDRGGFTTWAEAAAREMEAETEVERARKSKTS